MIDDEAPGIAARRAALRLLDAVLRRGLPLEAALAGATAEIDRADDRGLAHAIAAAVLRHLPDLDALIDGATQQRLPHDAKARFVLRMALAQALVLETPPHAAIATVLPLVDGGPRRLVHGVFGAVTRKGAALPDPPHLPTPVAKRWRKAWGKEMVGQARAGIATPPPIDLTLADPARTGEWTERLAGESRMPGHVRLPAGTRIAEQPGYAEGAWWVQNIAASIPGRLLGPGEERRALDLCAAPGGKAMQLAAAGWRVTAVDASAARLVRMRENLERVGAVVEVVEADILHWQPAEPVDAILLDAPCSATGIFARHPDVLHRVRPREIEAMAETQTAMLRRALDWLKPGGRLLYATCSLEPEEGEQVIESLSVEWDPIQPQEVPAPFSPHTNGWLRILPIDHADGFFVARFVRK